MVDDSPKDIILFGMGHSGDNEKIRRLHHFKSPKNYENYVYKVELTDDARDVVFEGTFYVNTV